MCSPSFVILCHQVAIYTGVSSRRLVEQGLTRLDRNEGWFFTGFTKCELFFNPDMFHFLVSFEPPLIAKISKHLYYLGISSQERIR